MTHPSNREKVRNLKRKPCISRILWKKRNKENLPLRGQILKITRNDFEQNVYIIFCRKGHEDKRIRKEVRKSGFTIVNCSRLIDRKYEIVG